MLKRIFSFPRKADFSGIVRRIFVSWLFAATLEYLLLPGELRGLGGLDGLAQMSIVRTAAVACVMLAVLWGISKLVKTDQAERWSLAVIFTVLASAALCASFTWAFLAACILILAVLVFFAAYGWKKTPEAVPAARKEHKAYMWITLVFSAVFFLFVSCWTVGRVYSFCSPTYDFGIFSQMLYSMKTTGLPMTTLERDGALSHFAVHVSPVWYLLLPFYWLVPVPATLQVLQAAVITSAVIPLWKLGKHHGLTGAQRMLICALLLLYPAYSGGTGYDIHENCFLTPFILWLFYGIDKKSRLITFSAAILTLTVKEDAAVYAAVIALWLIVKTMLPQGKKDTQSLLSGIVLLAVSLCWFFLVTGYLAKNGDGVMTWRYKNFMYDGSASLVTVIKSILLNPMKAIFECVDSEKLEFIALTLIPLLGLPFLTRRYERYILLIPYILVNLMPDYQYQHNIFFQYTFGSAAFLIYLTLLNLADLGRAWKRIAVLTAAGTVSAVCFGKAVVPKGIHYPVQAVRSFERYQSIRDALAEIPENASAAATGFYTACLSKRDTLYDVQYASPEHLLETQYVVLNTSSKGSYKNYAAEGKDDGLENLLWLLEDNGYELYRSVDGMEIYRREE